MKVAWNTHWVTCQNKKTGHLTSSNTWPFD